MSAKVTLTLTPAQFDAIREAVDTAADAWYVLSKSEERPGSERSQYRAKVLEMRTLKQELR
jgi:hypothetical protein